jgi:transcriptional regulator with XRE-family HTH domain
MKEASQLSTVAEVEAQMRILEARRTKRLPMKGTLGGVIQRLRQEQNLSLFEMAAACVIQRSSLHYIELNERSTHGIPVMHRIALSLGMKLSALISIWEEDSGQNDPVPASTNPNPEPASHP